jgi:hypothetical protein
MKLFLFLLALMLPNLALAGHGEEEQLPDNIYITAIEPETLIPEEANEVTLYIQNEIGEPVGIEAFEVVHTEPIHLLIIEPNLSDYHHKHPSVSKESGKYHFTFSPASACSYKIWADVKRVGKPSQYIPITLNGSEDCKINIDKTPSLSASTAGYDFKLNIDGNLKAGEQITASLHISRDGNPVNTLEPLMGAFAHLVGFYDDYQAIAYIHPMGTEPKDDTERGGPELNFHINPDRAGLLRLFAQVKIKDVEIFVPFNLNIEHQ